MTLYKFPSGKTCSDEDYKKNFETEYPSDRPEADPDFVIAPKNEEVQVNFVDDDDDEDSD